MMSLRVALRGAALRLVSPSRYIFGFHVVWLKVSFDIYIIFYFIENLPISYANISVS